MGMAQRVHAAQWQGARVLRNGKVRAWSFPRSHRYLVLMEQAVA